MPPIRSGGYSSSNLSHFLACCVLLAGATQPKEISPYTKDFVDILEAITQSGFYTEDPEKACIFVPPFNLLNEETLDPILASKALEKFSHWNHGVNNLLFSFVTG